MFLAFSVEGQLIFVFFFLGDFFSFCVVFAFIELSLPIVISNIAF